jgi:hypothetical protein
MVLTAPVPQTAERPCQLCGAAFIPLRATGRFCSTKCRMAAHRLSVTRALDGQVKAQKATVGLAKPPGGSHARPLKDRVSKKPDLPTLAEAGIDKNLAQQAGALSVTEMDSADDLSVTADDLSVTPPKEAEQEKFGGSLKAVPEPEPIISRLAAIMADPILHDPYFFGMPIRPAPSRTLSDDDWASTLEQEARCRRGGLRNITRHGELP